MVRDHHLGRVPTRRGRFICAWYHLTDRCQPVLHGESMEIPVYFFESLAMVAPHTLRKHGFTSSFVSDHRIPRQLWPFYPRRMPFK